MKFKFVYFAIILIFSLLFCLLNANTLKKSNLKLFKKNLNERKVMFITYNMGGNYFKGINEIKKIVSMHDQQDYLIISLQEVLELSIESFINNKIYPEIENIKSLLNNALICFKNHKYKLEFILSEFSTVLLIYKRFNLANSFKFISKKTIKLGNSIISEYSGAKVALMLAVRIDNQEFVFCGAHLSAHEKVDNRNERHKELNTILNTQINNKSFVDYNNWFILGDLNSRILSKHLMRHSLASTNNLESFIKMSKETLMNDDIAIFKNFDYKATTEKTKIKHLNDKIIEDEITFLPSYKFNKTCYFNMKTFIDMYVKKRVPSWTDRILYNKKNFAYNSDLINTEYLSPTRYNMNSDHQPVILKGIIVENK